MDWSCWCLEWMDCSFQQAKKKKKNQFINWVLAYIGWDSMEEERWKENILKEEAKGVMKSWASPHPLSPQS